MNELTITHKLPTFQSTVAIVGGLLLSIYSFIFAINKALLPMFDTAFFAALIGFCTGICLVLAFTIWQPNPIFTVNSEGIIPRLPNQRRLKAITWNEISEVNVGLYFLSIKLINEKPAINIDLSEMKYSDIKQLKTKIIEGCEGRNIPYQNA